MKKILLPFLLAITSLGFAQTDKKIWNLQECIDYALQNNLNVQRSLLSVETSEVNLFQSKMQMLPSLNSGGSYGYNWGRSIDPTTNLFITQRINSVNINAQSSVLLFNGFRQLNNLKSNVRENEASNEDLNKSKNDIILSVITFYTSVIFNKELFQNAQFQSSTTEQQLVRTRKLAEAGSIPRGDVLDLEAQHATNEVNLINRENALNFSLLQLKQSLQLPAATEMDVEVPLIDVGSEMILEETADEIFSTAKTTLPDYKIAQLRYQSALLTTKSVQGNLYPRLSVNGNLFTNYSSAADRARFIVDEGPPSTLPVQVGYVQGSNTPVFRDTQIPSGTTVDSYGISSQIGDNIARSLSLQLTIPIFNAYQSKAGVQRAVISQQQASINLKDTENRLRQSVETAYNDAFAAAKTYQSTLKQVTARDEAFRMTKQRFENGAVNFVEYQVAENNLFGARSDLVRAKYDFIFKKKVLDFYQGKPLEF